MKLTQKMLQEIRDNVLNEYTEKINKANELFKTWEKDDGKYEYWILKQHYEYYNLFDMEFQYLKEKIKEIDNKVKIEWDNIWVYVTNSSNYDEFWAEYNIEVKWYTIYTLEEARYKMQTAVRNKIATIVHEDIKAKWYTGYSKYIDCKILSLFDEWTIDYDTLVKLTYSDCNL